MRILRKSVIWHVGLLEPGVQRPLPRRRPRRSLEGRGLSVSEHPAAWRQIVRLGGLPLWELGRCDGRPGQFVDMLANEQALTAAAISAGLIVPHPAWAAMHTDEDGDVWYSLHATQAEAAREIEDDDDPVTPAPTQTWAPTTALRRRWARDFTAKLDPIGDFVAQMGMLYVVEDSDLDVDGAWWNENFDPHKLSAPRGVIFKRRLAAWCAAEIDWADAPDGGEAAEESW